MENVPPGFRAPFETVTADDQTAWVVIAATLGTVYSVIFLGFRIFIRRTSGAGKFTYDDIALFVATIFAAVQSSVILAACKSGLGKRWASLSDVMQQDTQQMIYAGTLLFVLALGLSKISVFLFLYSLTAHPSQKRVFMVSFGTAVAWTLASFLAFAFQCELPRAWETFGKNCSGSVLRWEIISALDIVIELLSIGLAVYLVWDIQIKRSRKWTVISTFAVRLLTIITTAFRLASLDKREPTTDPTFDAKFHVWLQAGMHISMISATVLILRPVIYNLNTNYGALGPTIASHAVASKGSYAMSDLSNAHRTRRGDTKFDQSLVDSSKGETVTSATATAWPGRNGGNRALGDAESVESSNSQRMIIKKTSWTIETDTRGV